MIILTSELSDAALDWAVAKARGMLAKPWLWGGEANVGVTEYYKFSTNWAQGGPIIESEEISIMRVFKDCPHPWCAERGEEFFTNAPTPLIAAMRCYVASKLGDQVDIPEELL